MTEPVICTKVNRVSEPDTAVPVLEPCNGHISVFVLGKTDIRICDRCDVPEPARSEVS